MWHICPHVGYRATFSSCLGRILQWIYGIIRIVDKVYELQDVKYYPVLVAHNGFNFDFLILLSELQYIPFNRLASINLHFADTYYDCKKQVKCNNVIFANWTATEKTSWYR